MHPLPEATMTAASIAGGAAGAIVNRSNDSRWRKSLEGFVGALVSFFCTPTIAASTGLQEPRDIIAAAFVVAAVGYGLLTAIIDWSKGANVREWLARFVGPKPPG